MYHIAIIFRPVIQTYWIRFDEAFECNIVSNGRADELLWDPNHWWNYKTEQKKKGKNDMANMQREKKKTAAAVTTTGTVAEKVIFGRVFFLLFGMMPNKSSGMHTHNRR